MLELELLCSYLLVQFGNPLLAVVSISRQLFGGICGWGVFRLQFFLMGLEFFDLRNLLVDNNLNSVKLLV